MVDDTPRAFVCGHPIAHSRSPVIHRYWLDKHQLPGDYLAVDTPTEELHALFDEVRSGRWRGGNITIPNKEKAVELVDWIDPAATAIGAVNTVWMDGDRLCGGNTDAGGFAANLDVGAPAWRQGQMALVLGAGGASRAVIFALIAAGYDQIIVANRTMERGQALATEFTKTRAITLTQAQSAVNHADLIINTTALGMSGHGDAQSPVSLDAARPDAIATDLVYTPLMTPFLTEAQSRGLRAVDGLGMLLHQAAPGFAHWFGVEPTVDAPLRQRVLETLAVS
jgi:shikimate dehydrogenase